MRTTWANTRNRAKNIITIQNKSNIMEKKIDPI